MLNPPPPPKKNFETLKPILHKFLFFDKFYFHFLCSSPINLEKFSTNAIICFRNYLKTAQNWTRFGRYF